MAEGKALCWLPRDRKVLSKEVQQNTRLRCEDPSPWIIPNSIVYMSEYHYQELKISSFIMNKINAFCVSSALSRDSILKTSPEQSAVWFLSLQREHIHFSFKDDLYNSLAVMKIQVFEVCTEVSFSSHPVPCFQATLLTDSTRLTEVRILWLGSLTMLQSDVQQLPLR